MKKCKISISAFLLIVTLVLPMGCNKVDNSANNTVVVQLLSFNDLHGQFEEDEKNGGGIANLAAYLKKFQSENENTITMSAGDQIGGSPVVTALKQDQPTLEIMKEMNVDVVVTGNHEYDEGVDELARIVQGGTHSTGLEWEGSEYLSWITANVVAKEDMKFGKEEIKKGDPILEPYIIKEFDGVKIGIIGIVTTDTVKKVVPDGINSVEFLDEAETIDKYTKELKEKGIKTIVVLSHVPAKSDQNTNELIDLSETSDVYDIAEKVNDEVDVIIAADNHDYANSVVSRDGKDDIVVVEAYSKSTNIARVDLTIDKDTGDVVKSSAEIVDVDPSNITADETVEKMVEEAREDVKPLLERKVGYAEELIPRNIENLNGESELGRLTAEAQLWAMKNKGENVDISLMNIGGVRADLEEGDITYEDIYTIQPFGNDLTKLKLNGYQLKSILEAQSINDWVSGLEIQQYNRPVMLQIAGFTYEWHPEMVNDEWVLKVDNMYLNDVNKTNIEDDTTLNTVVNIFLAQGGDGFDTFKEVTYEVVMSDLDAFENYIIAFSNKDNNGDSRLGINKPDVDSNPNIINLDKDFDGKLD